MRLRQRHTNDLGRTRHAQRDGLGLWGVGALVGDGAALGLRRAANLQHQGGDALDVLDGVFGIDAALEAVASVGREVKAPRTPGNRLGPPEGGFDVDVLRTVRHGGSVAAHDAGERLDGLAVGNHADFLVHGDGVAVEQLEGFARLAPAHLQAAVDFVEVKNMAGAAELEHDVVGDIDQRRDAALAAARQALDHPRRGLRLGVDAAHDAPGKAPAQVGGGNVYRQAVGRADAGLRKVQRLERCAGQGRYLARNAIDAQAVRQVGREFEREQRVVELQVLAHVLAQRRIGGQLQQAAVVVGNAELAGRAQHAVALHAAQLADLDEKGLAVFARGQLGPHLGAGHANAHARIGCAADDGQQRGAAHIDLAHAQAVGVGVLRGFFDFTDDDFGERRGNGGELFDLQPGHGQGVGQSLRGQRRVAKFAQPGFRKLHGQTL